MVTDISKFKSSTICFLNQGFSDDIKYPNNGENRPKKREHSVNITAKFFESLLIVSVGRASSVAFELVAAVMGGGVLVICWFSIVKKFSQEICFMGRGKMLITN